MSRDRGVVQFKFKLLEAASGFRLKAVGAGICFRVDIHVGAV